MSFVTLQIGQCGNQIGQSFYSRIFKEMLNGSPAHQACAFEKFFFEKKERIIAKSVLIDMEPKVVERNLNLKNEWSYDEAFSYFKQEGSGNNWAYGYNLHGPQCKEEIQLKISKILEEIDFCDSFVIMQSLAGGTGSGLGTFILENLKDEFPEISRINIGVLPHLSGDVILQSYNTLLSLSNLLSNSEGIIFYENDEVDLVCKKLLNSKNPTLQEMNGFIASSLASVFFPVIEKSSISSPFECNLNFMSDFLNNLVFSPRHKLIKIYNVPLMPEQSVSFSTETWNGLSKRLTQMLIGNTTEANIHWNLTEDSSFSNKILSKLQIARGLGSETLSSSCHIDSHSFNGTEKSMSAMANCQAFNAPLSFLLQSAYTMFSSKAYVFQYEKFGLTKDDFKEAFASCEQLLSNYSFER